MCEKLSFSQPACKWQIGFVPDFLPVCPSQNRPHEFWDCIEVVLDHVRQSKSWFNIGILMYLFLFGLLHPNSQLLMETEPWFDVS